MTDIEMCKIFIDILQMQKVLREKFISNYYITRFTSIFNSEILDLM